MRSKLSTRVQTDSRRAVLQARDPIAVIEPRTINTLLATACNRRWAMPVCCKCLAFSSNGDGFHNKIAADGVVNMRFPSISRDGNAMALVAPHRGLSDQQMRWSRRSSSDSNGKNPLLSALGHKTNERCPGSESHPAGHGHRYGQDHGLSDHLAAVRRGQKAHPFLADRNILIDQTMTNDFKPRFGHDQNSKRSQSPTRLPPFIRLSQAVKRKKTSTGSSVDFFDLVMLTNAIGQCRRRLCLARSPSTLPRRRSASPRRQRKRGMSSIDTSALKSFPQPQAVEDGFLALQSGAYRSTGFDRLASRQRAWLTNMATRSRTASQPEGL